MAQDDELRRYGKDSGQNFDDAYEDVDAEGYYLEAWNLRNTGTKGQEYGYNTNIEDLIALSGSLLPGINNIIGGGRFDDTGQILSFRYNSAGNCQMLLYDANTNTYQTIFTDVTDSAGKTLLPLNPQNIVLAILINKTYAVWWAKDLEVGYCNLVTLASGGYGTILPEDFSLLKPQCPYPPTGVYGNDPGTPANYWYGRLPQFAVQYVNADFNYSAWSTRSKRIVPYQENTPTLGNDVGKNNYIIIGVNIGSIRNTTINISRQIGADTVWYIIKSVDRSYITALPHTSVNVSTEIFEAFDPATNIYSYASYGNEIPIPINPNETDLLYDYIWPANAAEKINGNIIALADWKTLYERPVIPVVVAAIGYDPNIDIPSGTYPNPLTAVRSFPGASGSGAGNHKRNMNITLGGAPHTGDQVIIILADIRNAANIQNYSYIVPASQDGDLFQVVTSISGTLPAPAFRTNGDGTYTIYFTGAPYFGLQLFSVALFFAGATTTNSIPTIVENTSYQVAIECFDSKQRPLPITTGNSYIVHTPSKAQVNGNAVKITVNILNPVAPVGAVTYQVILTKPPVTTLLDVVGVIIAFKGSWSSKNNFPSLSINSGEIGDTYQITTPDSPSDPTYTNLGNFNTYITGDYVTNVGGSSGTSNGQSYSILSKNFANIAGKEVLCLSLNPLNLFNQGYSQQGVPTVLSYDYSVGDRCTLHSWIDEVGVTHYFNNPCIDLSVLGYDPTTYIVKVENSASLVYSGSDILYNGTKINARNIFFRLYSPSQVNQGDSAVQSTTEWFEVGEQFTITNGLFDTLSIDIFDGGAYFKTRQYPNGLLPYQNPPISVLATDLNYSDFYPSEYYSYGRARTDFDELEKTEQKASIITSQSYVLGSKNNGLNRFYPADIYGEGDGQTSSSWEAIQIMWQRGQQLVVIQGLNVFYIPVNQAYTVLNDELTGQSISEKLLNNGRYATEAVGIGTAKESFWTRYNRGGFIDPYKSLPFELTLSGIDSIAGKMSKYFKATLQVAYQLGKKLNQFYNDYYEEVVLCIQAQGGILILFPFNEANWNPNDGFVIVPGDVTETPNGANCTAVYDNMTGLVTYTPSAGFVGNNAPTFTFDAPGGPYTKNNCLTWTAGSTDVLDFAFTPQTGVALSTEIPSNTIGVFGPTIPVVVSITGGEYSVNGGAWTSASGTVIAGDEVQVRVLSSASVNTSTSTTLTISGTSATFTVTTKRNVDGTYTLTEQTVPTFVDGNLNIKANGVEISPFPVFSSSSGSFNMLEGDSISVEAFANTSNTGTGSQLKLVVTKDGDEIYNNTLPNNPPPDVSMVFIFIPVFGSVYDVTVTAFSNTDPPASCGIPVSYSGGEVFPGVTDITLGATTGDISLSFDSYSIPDKYEVWFDGVKVIDTGYRGDPVYQTDLDAALAARGLPPETIVSPGYGSATFTKGTATTVASVYVYAPMAGTSWTFQLQCPVTVDPFTFVDLTGQPISTLLESNSITVAGNATPATISVVGGEYSVNGGIWTIVPGSVNAGDTVKVRQTSSASYSTTTDTTLTIAGTSDTFSITTGTISTGYFQVIVDSSVPAGEIISIIGTGLPSGLNPVNQFVGPPSAFGFPGTIPSQVLTVNIDNPAADPTTNISVYYSSDGTTENNPVTVSGTYFINLTKNVVAPNIVFVKLILIP